MALRSMRGSEKSHPEWKALDIGAFLQHDRLGFLRYTVPDDNGKDEARNSNLFELSGVLVNQHIVVHPTGIHENLQEGW